MNSKLTTIAFSHPKPPQEKTDCDLLQNIVHSLVDGVLTVTTQGEWVYGNYNAHQICQQLKLGKPVAGKVPNSIWQICQLLLSQSLNVLERPLGVEGEVGTAGELQHEMPQTAHYLHPPITTTFALPSFTKAHYQLWYGTFSI